MLSVFAAGPSGLVRKRLTEGDSLPADAIWVDLLEPTVGEEHHIEQALGVDVPTPEEMREIEASNRLFEENGVLYMTMTVVTKLDTDLPQITQVTFILNSARLVTNRYIDPLPFKRFISYAETHVVGNSPALVLAGLLEAIVNRIADVLERVANDLDAISAEVFSRPNNPHRRRAVPHDYRHVLGRIGQSGELVSKTRESLVSLSRLLAFVQQAGNGLVPQDARGRFRTLSRDAIAMSDYASFLGDKVVFVLDATLGMVSIDQNNILKIFSLVTVFLLPPTVIGAFYGMNFEHIPWLGAPWGQWAALGMMVVSAFVPYLIFKRRKWL